MDKPFSLGIMVGRFQTMHIGHEQMIQIALDLCQEVGIFIGSSQESGTQKNPFSYEIRRGFIKDVFGDAVKVAPLPDIGVGNNSRWGEYVLENVEKTFGKQPDLLISGKEARRLDWFDGIRGLTIAELYIPKSIDISASEMRSYFLQNNKEVWKTYMNPKQWDKYDMLRAIVEASQRIEETSSL